MRFISHKQEEGHKREECHQQEESDQQEVSHMHKESHPPEEPSDRQEEPRRQEESYKQKTCLLDSGAAGMSGSPDIQTIVPEIQVENSTPEPAAVAEQVDLGSITKVLDSPGCFIRYEGKSGKTINWNSSYTDVLIPVLHHGVIASGVDKCDLCQFHLEGSCRRGLRCTYAHSWSERSEWICPICSKQDEFECQQKWEHTLQYQRVGIYSVADGRTVAEFLDSIT